jgi:hypothetical protein
VIGVVVISVSYLVLAWFYNLLVTTTPGPTTYLQELAWESASYFLTAAGAVLVALGWGLDQRATGKEPGSGPPGASRTQALIGYALVGVGTGLFAGTMTFFGVLFASEAASSSYFLNLPQWTVTAIYVTLGVGILAVAFGWLLQHLTVLDARTHWGP